MYLAKKRYLKCLLLSFSLLFTVLSHSDNAQGVEERDSYIKGKVYKNLISTVASYQLYAIDTILYGVEEKTASLRTFEFYRGLDYLVLGINALEEINRIEFLTKAAGVFKGLKAKYPSASVGDIEKADKLSIITKEMLEGELKTPHAEEEVLRVFSDQEKNGNKIITLYLKSNRSKGFGDTVKLLTPDLIEGDYTEIAVPGQREPVRLYNPMTTYCLSKILLTESIADLKRALTSYKYLHYLLDALLLLERHAEIIRDFKKLRKQAGKSGTPPYIELQLASAYLISGDRKRASELIDYFLKSGKSYIHGLYAVMIMSEINSDYKGAHRYLMDNPPFDMPDSMKACRTFSGSRGFAKKERALRFYYRSMARIYQISGDMESAFNCYYFTYRHSHGLKADRYDPVFLARMIDTALEQDVRPLLDEYLLRPPGDGSVKSFIDLYPGAYPIMYYWGLINRM